MTTLFLCRNAVPEANEKDAYTTESDLSANGVRSAELLGRRLADEHVGPIYASTSRNAAATARVVALALGRSEDHIQWRADLRQIDLGEWDGLSRHAVESTREWAEMTARPASTTTRVPGGETIEEVSARVNTCYRDIVKRSLHESILLVSHGLVIRLLLCSSLGLDPSHYLWSPRVGNASLSKVEIPEEGDEWVQLAILNSQDFLPPDLRIQAD